MDKIIIGSRGSRLALAQTEEVRNKLKKLYPKLELCVKTIKTEGDIFKNKPLSGIEDKGFFIKEIEEALLKKEIDLAVHSAKDLPTDLSDRLTLTAITKRLDPHDCLITKSKKSLSELQEGAKIGTGSLRRSAQLLNYRNDFKIIDIRGNIDTRIEKLQGRKRNFKHKTPPLDAIVLSVCGLTRLSIKNINTTIIPFSIILPAAGQASLGIEIRKDDYKIRNLLKPINDLNSYYCVLAERSLLKEFGGGCRIPLGCLGTINGNKLKLQTRNLEDNGSMKIEVEIEGEKTEAIELGKKLADKLNEKR